MEYRNIITFLRVAEFQNFTQAATSLGYAQSTVTFHIQSLEQELGVPLFDRIGKKVSLTMAGEYLVSYATKMIQLETKIRHLNEELESFSGTLRIGIDETLLTTYMAHPLSSYLQKYPHVAIEFHAGDTQGLLEMLRGNDVDIILIIGKRTADLNLTRSFMQSEEVSFFTSSVNPLAGRGTVSFEEVIQQPFILPEKTSLYRQAADEVAAQFDCVITPSIQVNNTEIIIHLVEEGLGISLLPKYLIARGVEAGKLVTLDIKEVLLQKYYLQILHHKNKWITPQMDGFLALMKKTLSG